MDDHKKHLLKLLDFSHVKNIQEVRKQAEKIAHELINNWELISFGETRRFLALEFYLIIPGIFEDDKTTKDPVSGKKGSAHKKNEQLSSGHFYFHSSANNKPPPFFRHGVDINCGNKEKKIYGGILLRHLSGENNQDGSGRALRAILRGDKGFNVITPKSDAAKWSRKELKIIEDMNDKSIFGGEIHLAWAPQKDKVAIKATTRFGIDKTRFAKEHLRFEVK